MDPVTTRQMDDLMLLLRDGVITLPVWREEVAAESSLMRDDGEKREETERVSDNV